MTMKGTRNRFRLGAKMKKLKTEYRGIRNVLRLKKIKQLKI